MKSPELPDDEPQRIGSLCQLNVLDSQKEERFDRVTRIAQRHFNVPIALVSLVDTDRQWFKSRQGLAASETPRDISFCGHTILAEEIFYIPNAIEDPRFTDNPLVTGEPNIRFYAGAPLHAPGGARVGTLCIIDNKPRLFSPSELSILRDLADIVEAELGRVQLLQVQTELAKKESQLQQLIKLSPGVIYSCNIENGYDVTYISPQVEKMLGYQSQAFIGDMSFWIKNTHTNDRERIIAGRDALLRTGNHAYEYRFQNADGNYQWIHDKLHLVCDEQGKPVEIIGLMLDITSRKELELEANYYKSIVHNSDDAIMSKTLDGYITSWNPAAERMFGYKANEAIGKPMLMIFPPKLKNEEKDILNRIIRGEKIEHYDTKRRRKNGNIINVSVAISPIRDEEETVIGASIIARDITERKDSERKLQDSASQIRAIVETVVDGIITIDRKGIVQTINPAAEQIFGYLATEVVGQKVNMLMPPPYCFDHDHYISNYLKTGEAKVIGIGREVEGKRKNGTTFPMELAVSEMSLHGKRMFTGIVRDITERKKIEQMKNEFISTVSHELRTPLTSIQGALGLVLGQKSENLSVKVLKLLEMANRNSERLTLLINDLLDLEKIESGCLDFEFETIDLIEVAKRAVEDNVGFAHEHAVKLKLNYTVKIAPVYGDQHRLLQVFTNLISNAVKYSPREGTVDITVGSTESKYRVIIQDAGPGIPTAFRGQIFQRFAQADSSDSREKGGTGLGLSISKAIIERHQGYIDYHTELGKGTQFYFDLPASQIITGESNSPSPRLLICEDNPDIAELLAEMVKSEGVICDIATTAAAAQNLLDKNHYRLMLLDLTLPDADGLELLQELRKNPSTNKLPIIVVSGRAKEGNKAFTGDAMMVIDWLQKPVDAQRLKRAAQEALKRVDRPHILHIEDDLDIVQITRTLLEEFADFSHTPTLKDARQQLSQHKFDLVILDLSLADGSGVDLLDELKTHCPVVIFSAHTPGSAITNRVHSALTKSITSNAKLKDTIMSVLRRDYMEEKSS